MTLFEGCIFGGAYIRRGLCTEGNLRFKIDWASLILGRKFAVFLCFTLYLRAISQVQAPGGQWRGDITEGFLRYKFWGLIFGGTYFRNFTVYGLLAYQIQKLQRIQKFAARLVFEESQFLSYYTTAKSPTLVTSRVSHSF